MSAYLRTVRRGLGRFPVEPHGDVALGRRLVATIEPRVAEVTLHSDSDVGRRVDTLPTGA